MILFIINFYRKVINKIFSMLLIIGRTDINIDASARILGLSNIKIGKNFYSGRYLWLEAVLCHQNKNYNPLIIIKDNVAINDFVHIGATNYVEIGNNVLMASHIYISDHNHGSYSGVQQSNPKMAPNQRVVNNDKKVIIGDNVWIGEGVSILPGVEIGEGSIVGASSVVTKNIPPYSIAVGNPLRIIKKYNLIHNEWVSIN